MSASDLQTIILLAAPLLVIQLGLQVFALTDLKRRERVKGGNKPFWVAAVLLLGILGPVLYFFVGREE